MILTGIPELPEYYFLISSIRPDIQPYLISYISSSYILLSGAA